MNLIVDIGNSRVKVAFAVGCDIVASYVYDSVDTADLEAVVGNYPEVRRAIVAATGVAADGVVSRLQALDLEVLEMNSETPVPIRNAYRTPQTLGMDRLAAAVAAVKIYGEDALIVDFGTAITYDLVTDGVFRGGNISLGVGARFRALHEYTEKLPLCEPTDEKLEFGGSTREAIEQGVMSGVEYETRGYIDEFCKKNDNLCIIFTGGDAKFFANRIKNAIFASCELTLYGLNRILEYNATKKDDE